jgi:hypothetical protein
MVAEARRPKGKEAELELAPMTDPELEAEVQVVAAWFEALPVEWQRYFDDEARSGRRAYGRA